MDPGPSDPSPHSNFRGPAATRLLLCCPDPMMLRHGAFDQAPSDIFSLRDHGLTCSLSSSDRARLLTIVARWQESSSSNAALLVCGGGSAMSSFAPAEGWVAPISSPLDDKRELDESVGWNLELARFQFVITGRLNRAASAAYSSSSGTSAKFRLGNACCDFSDVARLMTVMNEDNGGYKVLLQSGGSFDSAPGFSVILTRSGGEISENNFNCSGFEAVSFTDCVTQLLRTVDDAQHVLHDADATEMLAASGLFQLNHVMTALPSLQCVIGPVIGKVTMTTAAVLCEFNRQTDKKNHAICIDSFVEILCIDAVTGVRHPFKKRVPLNLPVIFQFDTLVPNRGYEIRILNNGSESETTIGSFKTASVLSGNTIVPTSALELKRERKDHAQTGKSQSTSEPKRRWLAQFLVVGANAPTLCAGAFGAAEQESDTSLVDAMISASAQVAGNAAYHRMHIEEGLGISRAIEELSTAIYNGIDLVIHIGGAVDLSVSLDLAISRLLLAEEASAGNNLSGSAYLSHQSAADVAPDIIFPFLGSDIEPVRLCMEAEELLRDAYRLHWGSLYMRGLLSKGSHLFVSSPAIDLLKASHMSSLQQLARELSPVSTPSLSYF